MLHQQLLDTDTEHPETANFKAEFLTLASDLVTGSTLVSWNEDKSF